MADISKITLPTGTTYDIKDTWARDQIATLSTYTKYLGVTTTALTDGATTNPVTIGEASVTAKSGDIVTYSNKEFIFNGTAWQEFGDLGALGDLAYKDSASGSFKPAGSVTLTKYTSSASGRANITPAGTVSQPTFTGTEGTVTVSGITVDSVGLTVSTSQTTPTIQKDITPSGTVSKPTFTGTQGSVSVSGTPSGSVKLSTVTTAATNDLAYTPSGTVSAPTVTFVTPPSQVTVLQKVSSPGATPSCTLPKLTTSVANENLTISWSAGSFSAGQMPTFAEISKIWEGSISGFSVTAPTFSGTTSNIHAAFTGSATTSTGNFTPTGTVSQPTFTGDAKYISAGVHSSESEFEGTFTPSGTVSQPTFTGTAEYIGGSFTGTNGNVTVS